MYWLYSKVESALILLNAVLVVLAEAWLDRLAIPSVSATPLKIIANILFKANHPQLL